MKKVAVLFSAGVESASLTVHYLLKGEIVFPVYVSCGLPWERVERRWAERLWTRLKRKYRSILPIRTLKARGLGVESDGIEIPLRNLILTTSVVVEATSRGIGRVAIGSLGIYPFPDNNRDYFDRLEALISEGLKEQPTLETPFMGMEKWEIIKNFYRKVPYELTFSCVKPVNGEHCGRCEKCLERKEGFMKAGVPDPTIYLS